MSNPDTAVALDEFPVEPKEGPTETKPSAADYEKAVVEHCNNMEFDDEGKWKVPEDMAPEMQFAVNSERRRRDTQSAQSKTQQQLKALEAKNEALANRLETTITPSLTVEQIEELENLKEHDPEAWRAKLNEHEEAAYIEHANDMEAIEADAGEAAEIARRTVLLEEFTAANPELDLSDDTVVNQLPSGLTNKLAEGELAFEDFLSEAKEFLLKGKTTKQNPIDGEPNLGASSGTSVPSPTAVEQDIVSSYENEIY